MKKQNINKIILIIFKIIVFLLILEFGLRIFYPQNVYNECNPEFPVKHEPIEPHPIYSWAPIKNFKGCYYSKFTHENIIYKTNNLGLRMENEVSLIKTKKRVLLLGDSFTFGAYLNEKDTYYYKLQKYLGEDYEVINMGIIGYGSDQEILNYLYEGAKLQPDIVVVNIFGNDYSDNLNGFSSDVPKNYFDLRTEPELKEKVTDENNTYYIIDYDILEKYAVLVLTNENEIVQTTNNKSKETNDFLSKYSHIYTLIKETLKKEESKVEPYESINDTQSQFYLLNKNDSALSNISLAVGFKIFIEMNKIAASSDSKIIFVNIPFRFQHDEKYRNQVIKRYAGMENEVFYLKKINKVQEDFMKHFSYNYLDLMPNFENSSGLYLKGDLHWNKKGADLAAQKVSEYIKNLK